MRKNDFCIFVHSDLSQLLRPMSDIYSRSALRLWPRRYDTIR